MTNRYTVCALASGRVLIATPPHGDMSADEALELAAWLVTLAKEHATRDFTDVLSAVQGAIS